MKSFADIKRALNEGATLTMVSHDNMPNGPLIGLARKIIKRQSNAIQFEGGSWLYLDKRASDFEVLGADSFRVRLNPGATPAKYMTYRIGVTK